VEILPVYFDYKKRAYLISRAQLYSNTPADFDFKLKQTARPLTQKQLTAFLKKVNLIFPVMHGRFGEDGGVQQFLERHQLPFVGSPAAACRLAFDKHISNEFIKQQGFFTLPSLLLLKNERRQQRQMVANFFRKHKINHAIVKPALGGSSIAVYSVANIKQALKASREIFSKNIDTRVVIEPFCRGKEFTVIILENKLGQPVAILPTEIELSYKNRQIFDYRRKYLATNQVSYHCPPRFSDQIIFKIQRQAEKLFQLFGLRDFARFDGWLLPDGQIWFSDFNPVSGMEQNSFLFMQASRLGMSHRDLLQYVVKNACRRSGLKFPAAPRQLKPGKKRKIINVIFGGNTSERQVSVMSGTNVWLKLKSSKKYEPCPFLLDLKNQVWRLPYTLTLNHTVEEIAQTCQGTRQAGRRLKKMADRVIAGLELDEKDLTAPWFTPEKMTLKNFIKKSPYVFIGLHGGAGENGQLQKKLEQARVPFNGSNSAASRLGMNKLATSRSLAGLEKQGIYSAKKIVADIDLLVKISRHAAGLKKYWQTLQAKLASATIIVKPIDDGCSAGIARLYSADDLKTYLNYALKRAVYIPQNRLTKQHGIIEMPIRPLKRIMLEKFITTDKIQVKNNQLKWQKNTGWVEITIGLLADNNYVHALNPSLTVASGNILTLEEKFQGGTGINITPPPQPFVSLKAITTARKRAEIVARVLSINGYARLDAFMNIKTGELIIIEANTLPGLTPSTVIFHQALAEKQALYPKEFLEKIIGNNY
jgi:D-alanine--D-alanine ligase